MVPMMMQPSAVTTTTTTAVRRAYLMRTLVAQRFKEEERQKPTTCVATSSSSSSPSSTLSFIHFNMNHHVTALSTTTTTTTTKAGMVRPRRWNYYNHHNHSISTMFQESRRQYTSPTSNAFWKDLNLAVKHGDGEQAESIVNGLLKSYEEQFSSSTTKTTTTWESESSSNNHNPQQPLDTRIFSLVLEAWRQSDDPLAAERAQQLLDQMMALAEEGLLTEPPSIDDYHAVLDCWAASGDATLQAAESALRITKQMMMLMMMQPTKNNNHESSSSSSSSLSISSSSSQETFMLVLQILANGGHAASARQFLDTIPVPPPPTLDMYNLILEAYSRSTQSDAPHAAEAFLLDMQHTNSKEKILSDNTEAYEEEEEDGVHLVPQPNGTSYDWVIQCWANHASHPDAASNAQRLLTQMKAQKLQTTVTSYQNVISILAQQGEAKQAERFLTSLVKDYGTQFDAQLKPTLEPFETVLLAYSKSFAPDAAPRAESVLIHMRELYETGLLERPPDAWSYNLVLKCWMHSRDPKAADRALYIVEDIMRADGIRPDTSTMNTVLNALAKQRSSPPERAEEFLWKFYQSYLEDPMRNPQPDVISFGTVLKAWALSNDPQASERAETLLLKLQNLHESGWTHCQPDQAIFSSVMKCYAQSKDDKEAPHKAEEILRTMQRSAKEHNDPHLKPDTVCWNMTIQAWAQAGQGPRAEALFKEMLQDYLQDKETGAAPNIITFSAVLSAWAKTQRNPQAPDRAETLLQQMKHLAESKSLPDIKPNVISYSIVLDCLAYAKTTAAAIRAQSLLREMQASDDPAIQPNVVSYNSVIKAWSLSRDPNALFKVMALLREMIEHAGQQDRHHGTNNKHATTTPNANTFGSVLKVLADSHVPDKEKRARVVVKLMEKFGIQWNDWSRNQMKRCARGDGAGSRGRRGRRTATKEADDLPDLPDLKYS